MSLRRDQSSLENLNLALRHYRRVLIFIFAAPIPAVAILVGLSKLGTWLSPPYGLYVLGWDLATWGLLALAALFFAVVWREGRGIGRALDDPALLSNPIATLIWFRRDRAAGQRVGNGMEGFFGPLRPASQR